MNLRGGYGRLRKARPTGGVADRWWHAPVAFPGAPSRPVWRNCKKPDRPPRSRLPIRQKGGGRKKATFQDPALLSDLEKLLEPVTRGDPQSPLRWTCKSVRNLAEELRAQGHRVSHMLVAELLHEQKYSLPANRKMKEGSSHPDRDAQFEYINAKATEFLQRGQPAISVDTKKKEQVGDYKNGGREWRPKGQPEAVQVHDLGKQKDAPYYYYVIN